MYSEERKEFQPVDFPISRPYSHYHASRGYEEDARLAAAKQIYGKNR